MIPYRFKFLGIAFFLGGLVLMIVDHFHKMKITLPVFALHSSYIQTKYLTVFPTNVFEEITMLSILAGLWLVVFSKEKKELNGFKSIRISAWQWAIGINCVFLAVSILGIYGRGFIAVLIVNMYSVFILYYILFAYKKRRYFILRKKQSHHSLNN